MQSLLRSFIAAIDAEIAFVEKNDRDRSYQLVSGQKEEKSTGTLFVFLLVDPLRIPEDSSGMLRSGPTQIPAMVIAQEGNRIWLLLDSATELPEYFPSAQLVLNETELLRKLRDVVAEISTRSLPDPLLKVFGKLARRIGHTDLSVESALRIDDEDTRKALVQCLGSDVTFLWGPPGTGKTFSIAALVAELTQSGESVLVTSHTHAAVEEALWATIECPEGGREAGPLYGSDLLSEGRLVKVGPLKSERIPREAHLDSLLDDKEKERQEELAALASERDNVISETQPLNRLAARWQELHSAERALHDETERYSVASGKHREAMKRLDDAESGVSLAQLEMERARRSFFIGRSGREARAKAVLDRALEEQARQRGAIAHFDAQCIQCKRRVEVAQEALDRVRADTDGLPSEQDLEQALAGLRERYGTLELEIETLKGKGAEDANEILQNALGVFATLTKLYVDRGPLKDMTWDTVVIDEASMAMPPLVAIAASRARKTVVIVGDMYQLPPVVHSPDGSLGGQLGRDIFSITGITEAIAEKRPVSELARLLTQRRMHPSIASTARELIPEYEGLRDHSSVSLREVPQMISAIGTDTPLVIVDTGRLSPWSGKMPGTLSRFNFLSGQAAVEIASLYASSLPEPDAKASPCIGIVTPYAAQRRYVASLVKHLGLERWVMCGTVHTFQGNECDVIIFDSVLGDPHWTSRMTNPHTYNEVRRDLNVAVTRARHQFVFIGDSKWLGKYARGGSAYGRLWRYLSEESIMIDACALLGPTFRERVAASTSRMEGWGMDSAPKSAALYTEASFYPAFSADLAKAKTRVVLYTPFIGKTRWPLIEPHVRSLSERGVEVYLLHKPLTDPEWKRGDRAFGHAVLDSLRASGVKLVPISGVHSKTIVIDDDIVWDGSLNWASQTSSYEHMWRFVSRDMAALVMRMLQLEPVIETFMEDNHACRCPRCGGPLVVVNQAQQGIQNDSNPMKLGCLNFSEDKQSCAGYLRRVDSRAPFPAPPRCEKGAKMSLRYSKTGRPWDWHCEHATCKPVRWVKGDCEPRPVLGRRRT
jgi:AAA domain/PLD-like domain